MTNGRFLPTLFIFQLIELFAGIYLALQGYYWLAGGCVLVILVFTIPVYNNERSDPKIDVNGDILTILNGYNRQQDSLMYQIQSGFNEDYSEYYRSVEDEERFRESIEIVPNDSRCIYRWKQ